MGHSLTLSGEIDRVALVNSTLKGPILAAGDWQSLPGFDLTPQTEVDTSWGESTAATAPVRPSSPGGGDPGCQRQ